MAEAGRRRPRRNQVAPRELPGLRLAVPAAAAGAVAGEEGPAGAAMGRLPGTELTSFTVEGAHRNRPAAWGAGDPSGDGAEGAAGLELLLLEGLEVVGGTLDPPFSSTTLLYTLRPEEGAQLLRVEPRVPGAAACLVDGAEPGRAFVIPADGEAVRVEVFRPGQHATPYLLRVRRGGLRLRQRWGMW